MKLTKRKLQRLILEEVRKIIDNNPSLLENGSQNLDYDAIEAAIVKAYTPEKRMKRRSGGWGS